MTAIRIAVEGCGHGTLHAIYASVEQSCKVKGWPGVDLLIICGDFQAVRNAYDLNCVAMPAKYREMCDFHEYYSGARKAPYLTVFVGGNHEASNYLFELYYGGWVAENIYYMGAANVLQLGPLRIAGMSGIWKGYNYKKLHYERLPYNEDDIKSIYHVRELDTRKLLQLQGAVDVGISHDWPRGVEWKGDHEALFRRKEHLKPDAESNQLGNVAAKLVLDKLQPYWWFSGHLHCKFAAVIEHGHAESNGHVGAEQKDSTAEASAKVVNEDEIDLDMGDMAALASQSSALTAAVDNPDEIDLGMSEDEDLSSKNIPVPAIVQAKVDDLAKGSIGKGKIPAANGISTKVTHFLALDKCLPGRDFLQLLEYPVEQDLEQIRPLRLAYDKEWLTITRAFAIHERLILGDSKFNAPPAATQEEYSKMIEGEKIFVDQLSDAQLLVPENFSLTAPVYDGGNIHDRRYSQPAGGLKEYTNPQTSAFCSLLDIRNPFDLSEDERVERMEKGPAPASDRSTFSGGRGRGRGGRGGSHNRGRGGFRGHSRGRG
ncbi:hypothetical protein AMS68_005187 [Peltaster fructicola]|uniref:Lariat debranching enzyme C-terminal domain-containing protein n=1 Tax=Peltaster fructicola TaxID=286661 RepID=A0A6H0XZ25_9PEZI|nr:hypothetical protein AMS68_005187 [Peltaster fructicola]